MKNYLKPQQITFSPPRTYVSRYLQKTLNYFIKHQNHKIVPLILTKYFDFWSWFLIDEKSFNKSFNASADHFQFTLHHVGLWTFGCHSDRSLEITIEFGCHSLKNFWPIESLLHNTVVAVAHNGVKYFVKLHSHFYQKLK